MDDAQQLPPPAPVGPRRGDARVAGLVILPDTSADDTDAGWGERAAGGDDRLLGDRPPHWDAGS